MTSVLDPWGDINEHPDPRLGQLHRISFVPMAPSKQRAVILTENGITLALADVRKPGPGQILVKVATAAQNPLDCQFAPPCQA
jgi:hypothetical protein